jgi:hypothetical protein
MSSPSPIHERISGTRSSRGLWPMVTNAARCNGLPSAQRDTVRKSRTREIHRVSSNKSTVPDPMVRRDKREMLAPVAGRKMHHRIRRDKIRVHDRYP